MSWDEWRQFDVVGLAELVKTRQVSPRDLTRQVAAAAERLNPQLRAILEVFEDTLENVEVDGPDRDGKLYGVPLLLKDTGPALKGRKLEFGSKLYRDNIAVATDPAVENCLAAGLIPLGRTTVPEAGMTLDTTYDYLGEVVSTRNPWGLDRTPGGSSGGAGAAVVAGIVPIAMSSDGGGSTRIPASFTGLIGLKASRGRVPRQITKSEYTDPLSIDGVVTRSVRDTAAIYDYLTRIPDGGAFVQMGAPPESYSVAATRLPGQLRVALSTGRWGRDSDTDSEVSGRIHRFAKTLEGLGHVVEEVDDGQMCNFEALWEAYDTHCLSQRGQFLATALQRGIDPERLDKYLSPMIYRRYISWSDSYSKFDLWRAMDLNNQVMRALGRFMRGFDLLLTPTVAIRVPKINGPYSLLIDEDLRIWWKRLCDACRYTMMGNESGLPGISLPAGVDSDGFPIGAQLYAKWGREDLLLQIAAQVEQSNPVWFSAAPALHV